MRRRKSKRRGVLLLVVLSLLVLFVLAGTTYVATSGQYRRSTISVTQIERSGSSTTGDCDAAVLQLVRGPDPTSHSRLLYHSLLRDFYGDDNAIRARVSKTTVTATDSTHEPPEDVVVIKVEAPTAPELNSDYDDYYTGCVLTMASGKLKGRSTRVLRYFRNGYPQDTDVASTYRVFVVENFEGANGVPQKDDEFLVNGRALNGLGAAYDQTAGMLDTAIFFNPNHTAGIAPIDPTTGGMDEGYDAADLNNMFLSWQPATLTDASQVIPAFHRPALANYRGFKRGENDLTSVDISTYTAADRDAWRASILRPTKIDHPRFTGGNALADTHPFGFDPINGPWDVDNDGDGFTDSVWLDMGMPPVETSDGKRYKPLFAILCLDLDGRVNVNAAGSLETLSSGHFQTDVSYTADISVSSLLSEVAPGENLAGNGTAGFNNSISALDNAPRGHGIGPAEISLYPMLISTEVEAIIRGRYQSAASNSFDSDGLPGTNPYDPDLPNGMEPDDDLNFPFKNQDIPLVISDDGVTPSGFPTGTPVDAHGLGMVALTQKFGQPVLVLMEQDHDLGALQFTVSGSQNNFVEGSDDPYEANLVNPQAMDSMYTAGELEPLLRLFDHDAEGIRSRLSNALTNPQDARSRITTQSFEVPVPNFQYPEYVRTGAMPPPPKTVFDFYEYMLAAPGPLSDAEIDLLIPREFRRGERFNVNREFDQTETSPYLGRQEYARQLYLLAMFLHEFEETTGGMPTDNAENRAIADQIAQWAINVVDFMDGDSVMTPFVYDQFPFDGWNPTIDPSVLSTGGVTDKEVTWGTERPELLITETLAWHDRRTQDLQFASNELHVSNGGTDPDFDQKFLPKGCLFVELFNPWTSQSLASPTDINGPGGGVLLEDAWRLQISELLGDPATDRFVRFHTPNGIANRAAGEYRPNPGPAPEVLPGQFAIVGTYEITEPATGQRFTPIGLLQSVASGLPDDDSAPPAGNDPSLDFGNTRRILWDQAAGQISLENNGADNEVLDRVHDVPPPAPAGTLPPVLIPVPDLSISEPLIQAGLGNNRSTYDLSGTTRQGRPTESMLWLSPPLDEPLDKNRTDLPTGQQDLLMTDQTIPSYRIAYLQRLADPSQAHNSTTNPWITVDAMTIDLTVFNGVSNDPGAAQKIWNFSRQRGDSFFVVDPAEADPMNPTMVGVDKSLPYRTLWRQQPTTVTVTGDITDPMRDLDKENVMLPNSPLESDLDNPPAMAHQFNVAVRASLGSLGHRYEPNYNNPPHEWEDQANPGRDEPCFPWLTWNNRPYYSAHELMLVPHVNPFQLLATYGFLTRDYEREPLISPFDFFDPPNPATAPYLLYNQNGSFNHGEFAPFAHLFNFFDGDGNDLDGSLHRIFDFVETPARFAGTEKWFMDAQFDTAEAMSLYRRPEARASRFRKPGLVNINTISSAEVWNAVTAGGGDGPVWSDVQGTMYSAVSTMVGTLDGVPVQFHSPFRPGVSGALSTEAYNAEASVLDSSPSAANFLRESVTVGQPLLSVDLEQAYQESYRNPYFYFRPATRLSNLATIQSNVFAVWITVGYFEIDTWKTDGGVPGGAYDPNGDPVIDNGHPDGLMLGQELGSDTGEITRHRSFYIIDRSIPVGFEPGKDHNVEDAIILRRFIE